MSLSENNHITSAPWFYSALDLRRDALFFVPVGMICAVIQFIGYDYFNKADWGTQLLEEHIPFNSLGLMVILLALPWIASKARPSRSPHPRLTAIMKHIAGRAVAFASVSASVTLGFAAIAIFAGAARHTTTFLLFIAYLVALAEITANLWQEHGPSKSFSYFVGIIIATPICAHFLH